MGWCFMYDGKPPDLSQLFQGTSVGDYLDIICERVCSLAKQFGRCLDFSSVGIGDEGFNTLVKMVDAAEGFNELPFQISGRPR
mmetsp:Transcript_19293/g.28533  ORF Transcript_19293/g.28533 Transcript_19293/m.28533 type:complete len:83 (+) Transcript_19293:42-290(+)